MTENIQEILSKTKTLQAEVIRRFMSEEDYNRFLEAYRQNRKYGQRPRNRFEKLGEPLSDEERSFLVWYLTDKETNQKEISERFGVARSTVQFKAMMAAVKVLYRTGSIEKILENLN